MSPSKVEPTVVCVMLTRDRPEMARRAVECFRRQTYPKKLLLILDTGSRVDAHVYLGDGNRPNERLLFNPAAKESIGGLRNLAGRFAAEAETDIIVHFDDDDWSHPERIAEQVSLLKVSGAAAVGCNEMLFWREGEPPRYGKISEFEPARRGEAWLYCGSILGTSLCYWRETWERVPFRATRLNPNHQQGTGEDADFLLDLAAKGMKTAQQPSIKRPDSDIRCAEGFGLKFSYVPRMIAGIHAGNTSKAYDPAQMRAHPQHWTRVPAWDKFCLETMQI